MWILCHPIWLKWRSDIVLPGMVTSKTSLTAQSPLILNADTAVLVATRKANARDTIRLASNFGLFFRRLFSASIINLAKSIL